MQTARRLVVPSAPVCAGRPAQVCTSLGRKINVRTPRPAPPSTDDNTALYADLLRRANGDRQLVALWLAEMGYDSADFAAQQLQVQPPQQQPPQPSNTIKAVGTREHGLGSWASAGASGSGKCKLGGTGAAGLGVVHQHTSALRLGTCLLDTSSQHWPGHMSQPECCPAGSKKKINCVVADCLGPTTLPLWLCCRRL